MVEYSMFKEDTGNATDTYGISYRIPGEQHILCNRMFKFQAEWLLEHLRQCAIVNPEFYPIMR